MARLTNLCWVTMGKALKRISDTSDSIWCTRGQGCMGQDSPTTAAISRYETMRQTQSCRLALLYRLMYSASLSSGSWRVCFNPSLLLAVSDLSSLWTSLAIAASGDDASFLPNHL